jgi:hypothetical protein
VAKFCVGAVREWLLVARRRRAGRVCACGALAAPRAARSTRTLGFTLKRNWRFGLETQPTLPRVVIVYTLTYGNHLRP